VKKNKKLFSHPEKNGQKSKTNNKNPNQSSQGSVKKTLRRATPDPLQCTKAL